MSCILFPKGFCDKLDALARIFWWGGKDDIENSLEIKNGYWWPVSPKNEGGIGFRNFRAFNLALLAKQVWRLLSSPDSLCASILKQVYFPNCSIFLKPWKALAPCGFGQAWWKEPLFSEKVLGGKWVKETISKFGLASRLNAVFSFVRRNANSAANWVARDVLRNGPIYCAPASLPYPLSLILQKDAQGCMVESLGGLIL